MKNHAYLAVSGMSIGMAKQPMRVIAQPKNP